MTYRQIQRLYSNAFDEGVNFYTQRIFNEDETSYAKSSLIGAGIGGTVLGGIARKNNYDISKEGDRLSQKVKELDKKWREQSLDVDGGEREKLYKELRETENKLAKFRADTPELEKKNFKHILKMGGIGLLGGAGLGLGYAYYKNNKNKKSSKS